ncbi:transposase [Kitasatospora aureofaciens]|uniref:transposase n=1 Tax=Kitasatospora aureofaciens TaxID=1894 RepID=UPI0037FB93A1
MAADEGRVGEGGRTPEPTAAIIDAQSLRGAETVGAEQRGYNGGKKVNETKRHIAVGVLGLLLAVRATAARVDTRLNGARRTCDRSPQPPRPACNCRTAPTPRTRYRKTGRPRRLSCPLST